MQKVLKGKRYNTDSAKFLAEKWNGRPNDIDFIHETLYRTKSGAYFLHIEGGARTIYGEATVTGSLKAGEQIVPISQEAAQTWAEKNLDGNTYEQIFGEAQEPEGQIISAAIPERLKNDLNDYCRLHNEKKSDVIRNALEEYIRKGTQG